MKVLSLYNGMMYTKIMNSVERDVFLETLRIMRIDEYRTFQQLKKMIPYSLKTVK